MNRRWVYSEPGEIPRLLAERVGGHPLIAARLLRQGITNPEAAAGFLDARQYQPCPPEELPGIDQSVFLLNRAIHQQTSICVWGDFDVDGQTSTALLVSTLRELGAKVSYHIPNREREGHGINVLPLIDMINQGVGLILTCDTGISAHEALAEAHQCGITTIVTDHHLIPEHLPEADAIVNPHLLPPHHPMADLPGVGVAFQLAIALLSSAGKAAWSQTLLDLVALGIVVDVAEIRADTRYYLQRGLDQLRITQRIGLRTMMEFAEIAPEKITEEHIGFALGPRLNALGRLSDANPAVELLTTSDTSRARILAGELEAFNARRKLLTDQVLQAAEDMLSRDSSTDSQPALVLSHPAWPAGVVGIVASRLVERYQKPVVLLVCPPGEPARGSARSVLGCDITAAIATQSALLIQFGGHAMAAGLSIDQERIGEFQRGLQRAVSDQIGVEPQRGSLEIDEVIPLAEVTPEFVADIERLAPFGPGNPLLVFEARHVSLQGAAPVGKSGEHLRVTVTDDAGRTFPLIWWQGTRNDLPQGCFELAYTVRSSDYQGKASVSLEWIDFQPVETRSAEMRGKGKIEIIDNRQAANPLELLSALRKQANLQVWREGMARELVSGSGRDELQPGTDLVVWTIPPGPVELHEVIVKVQPQTITLFDQPPGLDTQETFLERLAGMLKFTLRQYGGLVELEKLAAITGHRTETIQAGCDYLTASGSFRISLEDSSSLHCWPGGKINLPEQEKYRRRLAALLQETRAYRDYFQRAALEAILEES